MKRHPSCLLLLPLLFLLGCGVAEAQDTLGPKPKKARTAEDYKPRSLKEVAAEGGDKASLGNKEETMVVYSDILPTRVRVKHTGRTRPFQPDKKEVLRQWARLYAGFPEGYTRPYETEMLFVEDGAEHWLAVKQEALKRLEQEVKPGESVELNLIRVGAANTSDAWEPVLLVESFQKPK